GTRAYRRARQRAARSRAGARARRRSGRRAAGRGRARGARARLRHAARLHARTRQRLARGGARALGRDAMAAGNGRHAPLARGHLPRLRAHGRAALRRRMSFTLLRKELREHGIVLLFALLLSGVTLIGLLMQAAESMGGRLIGHILFIYTVGPLLDLVYATSQRFREYCLCTPICPVKLQLR